MSQKYRIRAVKFDGAAVYLGLSPSGNPMWTRNPMRVMEHFASCWQAVFNGMRAYREEWEFKDGVKVGSHPLGSHTDQPMASTVGQMRERMPWLASCPTLLLHSAIRHENIDWYAGLKRKKKLGGPVPGLRRRNRCEPMFMMFARNGKDIAVRYRVVNRRSGCVEFNGMTPKDQRKPGDKAHWRIRIFIRLSEPVREFTKIIVHPSRNTIVFVNPVIARHGIPDQRDTIGADRGCKVTMALSDGRMLKIPQPSKRERRRLVHLQRRMSRMDLQNKANGMRSVRDSRRREKLRAEKNRLETHIRNRKHDWIEQQTTSLVLTSNRIALEALDVKRMTRRAKPKPDPNHPGQYLHNGRKAKSGLNQSILSNNWGEIRQRLTQKASLYDTIVKEVNPAYTSQTCSQCHYKDRNNRKSQALFHCLNCGYTDNADHNAGANIRDEAFNTPDEGSRRGGIHRTQPGRMSPPSPEEPMKRRSQATSNGPKTR
ncbi:RNA-guided endonuclease InsQ/TnpB family protein [Bifidobacterium callitrichidarum]|uniref:Transposase n=1 Tax=Bifidobacterium callitrichidarum TaxID=2052941 RepID=A0A2U2MZ46_9BIFI|nr:RNA-guided endonuclease TnpB family protein [Bifidobacterium callitrichidarum]PWG62077.1 transposase [Bifidobacterium callitrichidarum]